MTSDNPLLIDTGKGFTVKYRDKFLYSSVDPAGSAIKRAVLVPAEERTLYLVPSIGLGYGLTDLISRITPDSHVLCTEADQTLNRFSTGQSSVPLPVGNKITYAYTPTPSDAVRALREIGVWRFRRVRTVALSQGRIFHPESYTAIETLLEDEIQTFWKNKLTMIRLGPLWIKNIFYNLPLVSRSNTLANCTVDGPILVVGAGPSLDGSIEIIRRHRKSFSLICVDTAFPALAKSGIRPDAIIVLEAQHANIYDFIADRARGIPLLCDLTAHPPLLRLLCGEHVFFSSEFFPVSLLDRLEAGGLLPPRVPPMGSVGVAALHCAIRLSRGPVFVTGLDFAYSDGRTHAAGTPFHDHAHLNAGRFTPVSNTVNSSILGRPIIRTHDKNGAAVMSDLVLASYAQLAQRTAAEETGRLFDIGKTGLELGLQRIDEPSFAMMLAASRGTGLRLEPQQMRKGNSRERITTFLENELDLLKGAKEVVLPRFLDKPGAQEAFDDKVVHTTRLIDYAYLHFPEPEPVILPDKNYMMRLLVSIEHYREVIERTLALVHHGN